MIVQVAVPCPLYTLFDYEMAVETAPIGHRVNVPFGPRRVVGIVVGTVEKSEYDRLKTAECLDESAAFTEDLLRLGQWIANYYHAPIGLVYRMMLPQKLRKLEPYQRSAVTLLTLSEHYQAWMANNAGKTAKVTLLETLSPVVPIERTAFFKAHSALKSHEKLLLDEGIIIHQSAYAPAVDHSNHAFPPLPYVLNAEQQTAVDALQLKQFSTTVLEGVTGSGKTAVYLEWVKKVLAAGRQVLILVPEIGLTPQFIERVERILNIPFVVVHSEVNETQKMAAWEAARHHTVPLVIGTRSALFTPFDDLGLIIIDEEHDGSYRQRDTVRYSAHDAAITRAHFLKIPIVLGSATPILETVNNVARGRYQHLSLASQAKGAPPKWSVVDMNEAMVMDGLSSELLDAIEETLARKEQVIIYINRRGYSPVLMCESCGWVPECTACQYRLTVYRKSHSLRCHHCGHRERLPQTCPSCDSHLLKMMGQGTERIEKALSDAFPQANVVRFDRDQLRTKNAFAAAVNDVIDGTADIIIGTQMIAKGHDFAKVTLVGMLDIDGILYSSDFRAEEKLAQTLMQVSGRAGRDVSHGRVMIQTHFPDHALFTELAKVGYGKFAKTLLAQREDFEFPPFAHQALFQVEGVNEAETLRRFEALMAFIEGQNCPITITPVYPNALSKRQNFYRFYVVLQSADRRVLHQWIDYVMAVAAQQLPSHIRHFCEIDPWDFD
ncbi:primosomal protein N' [Wohlfahrtiimonas chitiniclastica]|uniref:primosomal protein N' n=1 Tax=Wohlfahrtiimonas chitiniclastica TaxID=400946 RepID=UPI0007B698E5|nr:primosomal protein N' [Wohlfahrtiimonas chitiniclastica]KZX37429.1 primosomal protein N' [Wohlfahrtiimonas chitiniclastica]